MAKKETDQQTAEIHELTDQELTKLIVLAVNERETRRLTLERAEDLERRRQSIRAGKGDPGPRR